jgi:hypothetical protein
MWLLHLCDAHQEMQSWAEAAQCAVAVAGVVMQVKAWFLGISKNISQKSNRQLNLFLHSTSMAYTKFPTSRL